MMQSVDVGMKQTTNLGNQRVYDEAASYYQQLRWFKTRLTRLEYQQTERALLAEFKPSAKGRYLEIGCGPGTWTKVVAPHVGEVIALDISANMIEQASKYVGDTGKVTFVHSDANDYTPDGQLDGIFSFRVLEYVNGWEPMLKRAVSQVKSGGRIAICTKTPISVYRGTGRERWFSTGVRRQFGRAKRAILRQPPAAPSDFWQVYISPSKLQRALREAGCTDFRVVPAIYGLPVFARGTCQYPLVPGFAERPFMWLFETGRKVSTRLPSFLRKPTLVFSEAYVISATKR